MKNQKRKERVRITAFLMITKGLTMKIGVILVYQIAVH